MGRCLLCSTDMGPDYGLGGRVYRAYKNGEDPNYFDINIMQRVGHRNTTPLQPPSLQINTMVCRKCIKKSRHMINHNWKSDFVNRWNTFMASLAPVRVTNLRFREDYRRKSAEAERLLSRHVGMDIEEWNLIRAAIAAHAALTAHARGEFAVPPMSRELAGYAEMAARVEAAGFRGPDFRQNLRDFQNFEDRRIQAAAANAAMTRLASAAAAVSSAAVPAAPRAAAAAASIRPSGAVPIPPSTARTGAAVSLAPLPPGLPRGCSRLTFQEGVEIPNCPICLEPLNTGSVAIKTPCNHDFHSDCLLTHLRESPYRRCPMCRGDL